MSRRNPYSANSLLQKPSFQYPKQEGEYKAEAHAILSYGQPGMRIPSRRIETRLRKMKGIKEVKINHVSRTVKIHYDPSVVTIEKIRTLLATGRSPSARLS